MPTDLIDIFLSYFQSSRLDQPFLLKPIFPVGFCSTFLRFTCKYAFLLIAEVYKTTVVCNILHNIFLHWVWKYVAAAAIQRYVEWVPLAGLWSWKSILSAQYTNCYILNSREFTLLAKEWMSTNEQKAGKYQAHKPIRPTQLVTHWSQYSPLSMFDVFCCCMGWLKQKITEVQWHLKD